MCHVNFIAFKDNPPIEILDSLVPHSQSSKIPNKTPIPSHASSRFWVTAQELAGLSSTGYIMCLIFGTLTQYFLSEKFL